MRLARTPILPLLILFSSLFQCAKPARALTWHDIERLEGSVERLRSRNFTGMIELYSNKDNPDFIDSFATGIAYKKKKDYRKAIVWLARAVSIKRSNLPKGSKIQQITSYIGDSAKDSPIANEALYFIAESYAALGHIDDPQKIIALIKPDIGYLEERSLLLKAEVETKINKPLALQSYIRLAEKYTKVTYYIRAANILKKQKQFSKAVALYAKAFDHAKIYWAYRTATRQIMAIDSKYRKFSSSEAIRYAEGLRRLRKYKDAKLQLATVIFSKLPKADASLYINIKARLLVNLGDKERAMHYIKSMIKKLDFNQRVDLLSDVGNRLNRMGAYRHTIRLISSKVANEGAQRRRIMALYRLKVSSFKKELENYMSNYKKNFTFGERLYFNFCLPNLIAKKYYKAEKCLLRLKDATQGQAVGGRARFYLARIYQKTGREKMAQDMYRQVYLQSVASSYTFKALKAANAENESIENLPFHFNDIKAWVSRNAGNPKAMRYFLERKKNQDNYAIDPFWLKWQQGLKDFDTTATQTDLKIALFLALDMPAFANATYHQEYKTKKLTKHRILLYQRAAISVGDTHIKHLYMKYYLKLNQKQVDVFLMSKLAASCIYPMPFYNSVKRIAAKYKLQISAIYALMKQESQFHSGATSVSNAKGLMQVLPSTGRWVNLKLKIPQMNLYNPQHNLAIGIQFFADMNRQFHGDFEQIAAAYNGGPGWLSRRKKKISFKDKDLFIERMDRLETHYYVKITRANKAAYDLLLNENF